MNLGGVSVEQFWGRVCEVSETYPEVYTDVFLGERCHGFYNILRGWGPQIYSSTLFQVDVRNKPELLYCLSGSQKRKGAWTFSVVTSARMRSKSPGKLGESLFTIALHCLWISVYGLSMREGNSPCTYPGSFRHLGAPPLEVSPWKGPCREQRAFTSWAFACPKSREESCHPAWIFRVG